ncbi:MAG: metallophosphoesterase [Actinomycetota bacterium]|nr:metallophosphoesterase [Actinomycetota bacterium]
MRTLVISDLHLGNRAHRDTVRRPAVRERLLDALDQADRLVLLGDVAELVRPHPERSLAAAEPVLRAVGRRLGRGREVILVPGNHDRPLLAAWARAQGRALTADCAVPPGASAVLSRVVSWLAPATVQVRYPGVWLDDRTYATHGHYLDRHLVPEAPVGLSRGLLARLPSDPALPQDYERRRHRDMASLRPQRTLLSVAAMSRKAVFSGLPHLLHRTGLSPVTVSLANAQVRRAALPALSRTLLRLGLAPDFLLFGHIHRRGPLPGDRPEDWQVGDRTRLVNTGGWLYEPLLIDGSAPPHPYWPGGALLLSDGQAPRSVGLLDDLTQAQLRPPPRPRRR